MTEEKNEDIIDESFYDSPYAVKNNCLCEMVNVKDQVIPVKLADFVPMLAAEITRDESMIYDYLNSCSIAVSNPHNLIDKGEFIHKTA